MNEKQQNERLDVMYSCLGKEVDSDIGHLSQIELKECSAFSLVCSPGEHLLNLLLLLGVVNSKIILLP